MLLYECPMRCLGFACLFFQGNCEIYIPRWVRISWTTLTFSARVRRTCDKMAKTWPTACAFLRSTDNRWWMAAAQSSTQTASQNWLMNSLCIQLGMWRGKTCVWEREKKKMIIATPFVSSYTRVNEWLPAVVLRCTRRAIKPNNISNDCRSSAVNSASVFLLSMLLFS